MGTEEADSMTEDQAKQKWCPYQSVRVQLLSMTLIKGASIFPENAKEITEDANQKQTCIGSACMMWKWSLTHKECLGYCGLAGDP